jgi:D-alanyl-D-alanine carboxypeptidase
LRLTVHSFLLAAALIAAPAVAHAGPAYIVVDAEAGTVLADRDADRLWQPASVTKLMTAYLAFDALKSGKLKPTSPIKISTNALNQAPSKMGFRVGTVLNVDNALKMMLVKSANDIAVAVAETVGGSESAFVAMMNREAQRLGMNATHFDNPNGLPDDSHLTTARDLAVLARAIWVDFPEQRSLFTIPAIIAGKRVLRSQNALLERYHGANGMKTGFVCASGYNMVASATRFGRTLMVVVVGATSSKERAETAATLLNQGFGNWFTASRPPLASFETSPAAAPAANMHDIVCGRHVKPEDEGDDPSLAGVEATSALEPRFEVMAPVPVYTGRADGYTGSTDPAVAVATPDVKPASKTAKKTVTKAGATAGTVAAATPVAAVTAAPVAAKLKVPVPKPRPQ